MSDADILDLDAVAAEVAERKVRVGGKLFTAPGDLTVTLARDLQKLSGQIGDNVEDDAEKSFGLMERFLAAIFGEEHATELMGLCTLDQLVALITGVSKWYGLDTPGKVQGSSRASRRSGAHSKPTSAASTKSASLKRASAKRASASRS